MLDCFDHFPFVSVSGVEGCLYEGCLYDLVAWSEFRGSVRDCPLLYFVLLPPLNSEPGGDRGNLAAHTATRDRAFASQFSFVLPIPLRYEPGAAWVNRLLMLRYCDVCWGWRWMATTP